MYKILLPSYARKALDLINSMGFEAYVVGGCVRDSLLGKIPCDWDIATSAKPSDTESIFKNFRLIETGIKHGTVTVIIDDIPLEITTYRIDGDYCDNRHPSEISFSDTIEEDLSRRDFTVNSIAYNLENGIVDPFGGIADIQKKVIKCVGEPDKRFNEDALRILRGLRFSSVLDFDIEPTTAKSIIQNRSLLKNISAERISSEFCKLVSGKSVDKIFNDYIDVIKIFLPEIKYTRLSGHKDNLFIRLALLFDDFKICRSALKRLRFDNNTIGIVSALVRHKSDLIPNNKPLAKHLLNETGADNLYLLYDLWQKDTNIPDEIIINNECYSLAQLDISGSDLIPLGYSGNEIGKQLNFLLEMVIDEKCENKKSILLEKSKQHG